MLCPKTQDCSSSPPVQRPAKTCPSASRTPLASTDRVAARAGAANARRRTAGRARTLKDALSTLSSMNLYRLGGRRGHATESTRDRRAGQRGSRRCGCQEAAARPNRLIAGKAYDVDRLRTWPKARHIEAAMSLIAPRTGPSPQAAAGGLGRISGHGARTCVRRATHRRDPPCWRRGTRAASAPLPCCPAPSGAPSRH
jgi:hypothetical protein